MIKGNDMVNIMRRTYNLLDARLVNHGERVAYILYEMLKKNDAYTKKDILDICTLAFVHDIGAYKTDEIDKMVEFESTNVWEHSIYGYLFLKNMSPLAQYAEVVLYHHLPYNRYEHVHFSYGGIASLLHLADRIDALIISGREVTADVLQQVMKWQFRAEDVALFLLTEQQQHLLARIRDGSYRQIMEGVYNQLNLTALEIENYLELLAFSIDFRSEHTVTHTITTVGISRAMASLLKLTAEKCDQVHLGALLHDLGKIAIPVEILEKPGKLTSEETRIMQTHIVITRQILQGYVSDDILEIAVRHHEKMDGTGYPDGLTGEHLTVEQRIVAIADIISALAGTRSYKKAYDKEKIKAVLLAMAEDHKLCPILTTFVVANYDQIISQSQDSCRQVLITYGGMLAEYERLTKGGITANHTHNVPSEIPLRVL